MFGVSIHKSPIKFNLKKIIGDFWIIPQMSFHVETNQKTVWPLTWYLRAALLHKMMKCLFCCRGPTEAGCCVVVLSSFHFVPSVWVTKAVGESAACAGGFQAVGSSVRQQQKSREQSYGSVLLLSLRPHPRLHISKAGGQNQDAPQFKLQIWQGPEPAC